METDERIEQIPDWFREVIRVGISRLFAAKLKFPPTTEAESGATALVWCEDLWLGSGMTFKEKRALEMLQVFREMATHLKEFPQPAEFLERWKLASAPKAKDYPRLPAPELSPERKARVKEIRQKIIKDLEEKESVQRRVEQAGEHLNAGISIAGALIKGLKERE